MRRSAVHLLLLSALFALACEADETLLRQAWTYRPGPKEEEFAAAAERFEMLVERWAERPAVALEPHRDRNATWLLAHRQATYLVVDMHLRPEASGALRSVLLYLTGSLGYRNLGPRVAPLLAAARNDRERLETIRCLSALQDPASLRALMLFVQSPPQEDVSEETIAAAVSGMGLSRRADLLGVIVQARGAMRSPGAMLEWAKAAYRCGDRNSMALVIAALNNTSAPPDLRRAAIAFLCENFGDEALTALARVASESDDDELSLAAIWALVNGTGYGRPDPTEPLPEAAADNAAPGAEAEPVHVGALPGLPADLGELSRDERKELVQTVVNWWLSVGKERKQKRSEMLQVS